MVRYMYRMKPTWNIIIMIFKQYNIIEYYNSYIVRIIYKKTRLVYNKRVLNQNTKLWLQKQTLLLLTEASTIRICLNEPNSDSCLGIIIKYQSSFGLTIGGVYWRNRKSLIEFITLYHRTWLRMTRLEH